MNKKVTKINKEESNNLTIVKYDKEKQSNLKLFSKIVSILASVFKVFAIIAIPFVIITMIIAPGIIKNINIKNDEISFTDNYNYLSITDEENKIVIKNNFRVIAEVDDIEFISVLNNLMNTKNKRNIITSIEVELVFLITSLVFIAIFLKQLAKLFKNINILDTPFTIDNTYLLRKMAYLLTAVVIISTLSEMTTMNILESSHIFSLSLEKAIIILALYVLTYVFEYGTILQSKSKERIYDHE